MTKSEFLQSISDAVKLPNNFHPKETTLHMKESYKGELFGDITKGTIYRVYNTFVVILNDKYRIKDRIFFT